MFQTSSVSHQERFVQAVFADFVTAGRVEEYAYYHMPKVWRIQLVQNAPDDGPMRSPKHVELTQVLNKLTY